MSKQSEHKKQLLLDRLDSAALFVVGGFTGMWFALITIYDIPTLLQVIVVICILALMYRAFSTGKGDSWDGAVLIGCLSFGVFFLLCLGLGAPTPDFRLPF